MPTGGDYVTRVLGVAGGLHDRAQPLLITEDQASSLENFNLNRMSADEAYGYRRLNDSRVKMGGVRLTPTIKRGTSTEMTRWRDGYMWAPASQRGAHDPAQIDISFRVEEDFYLPDPMAGRSTKLFGGLTGRSVNTVAGTQRPGGEHQFFPLIANGARETEVTRWCLGIGVVLPHGMKNASDADISNPDRVVPVFWWYQSGSIKWSAADFTVLPHTPCHLSVTLPDSGAGVWYVNGSSVSTLAADAYPGISALPTKANVNHAGVFPTYFGRCATREPDIYYDAAYHGHKHAQVLGKYDCVVGSGGISGSTVDIDGNELASQLSTADSFDGWRMRVVDSSAGSAYEKIFQITDCTNPTNDGTITLTLDHAPSGLAASDLVDIIPPVEPVPLDVTIQEARLWNTVQTSGVVAALSGIQASSDLSSTELHENPLAHAAGANADPTDLLAYWPMNDDGGVSCREMVASNDAYFGPSLANVSTLDVGSVSARSLNLDGETNAVQVDLREDPNFGRNYIGNLGAIVDFKAHWNVCARMQFRLGSGMVLNTNGNIQNHSYETLFSMGSPKSGTPALECRVSNSHASGIQVYFLLPDGTFQTIAITNEDGAAYYLKPGVWYNAILGIQAIEDSAGNVQRHYTYFQALDASSNSIGGFSAAYNLPSASNVGKITIDPTTQYLMSFGASVRSVASNLGSQTNNHSLLSLGCVGYGFHPANFLQSGITAPVLGQRGLVHQIHWDEITQFEETAPLIGGHGQGGMLTKGSNQLTVSGGSPIPPEMRRWHIVVPHLDLVYREKGEADIHLADNRMIVSVTGTSATLNKEHTASTVSGVELRAQLWAGYTSFETLDPTWETSLNMGVEDDETWARTDKLYSDIARSPAGFAHAVDPSYEFTSPFRIAPRWSPGVVSRKDIKISGLTHYKKSDGDQAIIAIAGGTCNVIDPRWRAGDKWSDSNWSWAFLGKGPTARRKIEASQAGAQVFSASGKTFFQEGIEIPNNPEGATEFSPFFERQDITDSGESVILVPAIQFEADIWLDGLDGRRTILGRGEVTHSQIGGSAPIEVAYKKNIHWYVDNGSMVLEIRDDTPGTAVLWRMRTNDVASSRLRPHTWHRVMLELTTSSDGGVNRIDEGRFFIDGRLVDADVDDTAITFTSIPQGGSTILGAIGEVGGLPFSDVLGGRIGGFRFGIDFAYGSTGSGASAVGNEYTPTKFVAENVAAGSAQLSGGTNCIIPFDEGEGTRTRAYYVERTAGAAAPFLGDIAIPVGSGMGHEDGGTIKFATFGDVLYWTNFITRPWRYDMDEMTPVGIQEPSGELREVEIDRKPFRIKDSGCDLPLTLSNDTRLQTLAASPMLRTFQSSVPDPAEVDVGCLMYMPADEDMGASSGFGACDYIGTVSAALPTGTIGYDVSPPPFDPMHIGYYYTWTLFRSAKDTDTTSAAIIKSRYKRAISNMPESTTPWSGRRLMPAGKNQNTPPRNESLTTDQTNAGCFHFRGNQFVEFPPFKTSAMPVGIDKVLDMKMYIRLDDVDAFGDDEMVVAEQGLDGETGSWRVTVFEAGRIKFSFYDVTIAAIRSISTVGKCFSPKQWYFLRFRYKFKNAGSHIFDTDGGWEPDLNWLVRSESPEYGKVQSFRDGLWVYACEGLREKDNSANVAASATLGSDTTVGYDGDVNEAAPCMLLTLPGSHSMVNGASVTPSQVASYNHSHFLLNGGLLKSAPYITPERGDGLFPEAIYASSTPDVNSGIELTITTNEFGGTTGAFNANHSLDDATGIRAGQCTLPTGFVLPRTCSMNRDDAWNRQADNLAAGPFEEHHYTSQLYRDDTGTPNSNVPQANYYSDNTAADVHLATTSRSFYTPNLANFGLSGGGDTYGRREGWAILCRIWRLTDDNSGTGSDGDQIVKAADDPARVLAVVHVGDNDLGHNERSGKANGHTVFLTDDPIYGGDGLGDLYVAAGKIANGAKVHATFEWMNGTNQSVNSPNTNVTPCLLEQGTNPVGVNDSPASDDAPIRIGGTSEQDNARRARSGLRGRLDNFSLLIADVVRHETYAWNADVLPPDCFFTGPADTRFQSLPKLHAVNHVNIQDDYLGTGDATTAPTLVVNFNDLNGDVVVKDATSAAEAPNGSLIRSSNTIQREGEHRLRVTFYDPKQNVESGPGPEFSVDIDGDEGIADTTEGLSTMSLSGIPISGDRREKIWRRIYKTLPDGGLPLLWAEIRDNSTVSISPRSGEDRLSISKVLEFDNRRPPICRAIEANESNLFYGGLDDAPNVITFSKAFEPEHVPGDQILFAESSRGGRVTALGYLRGALVPSKPNAIFVAQPAASVFKLSRVGQDVGCISPVGFADMDGLLYFPTLKGIYVFSGNQRTYEASSPIERLYREDLDLLGMRSSSGSAYLRRGQYLVTAKLKTEDEPNLLLACEQRYDKFGNTVYVWTKLKPGIPIFTTSRYEDPAAETPQALVGGRGYVYLYDTGSGVGVDGVESDLTGSLTGLANASSSNVGRLYVDGMTVAHGGFNTNKDGLAGCSVLVVRETDIEGNAKTAGSGSTFSVVLHEEIMDSSWASTSAGTIYPKSSTINYNNALYDNATVIVGGYTFEYRTRWFENITGERLKHYRFLDVMFRKQSAGASANVFAEFYCDFDDENMIKTMKIPLNRGHFSLPIPELNARWLQVRFRGYGWRQGFELLQYSIRAKPHAVGVREHE